MTLLLPVNSNVTFIETSRLKHIEGFSVKRMEYLLNKIELEKIWTKPLCVERNHSLVLDGQHRMEAAKVLRLNYVPCIEFDYHTVEIWSLRKNYHVDHKTVIERALQNNIYPFKTVKHRFPLELPKLVIPLEKLLKMEKADNLVEGIVSCV